MHPVTRSVLVCIPLALSACLRPRDSLIPDLAQIVDSLDVATHRTTPTSGAVRPLLGTGWRHFSVLDARKPVPQSQHAVSDAALATIRKLVAQDSAGAVIIFGFHHGATQAVFVPRSRAAFAPEMLGRTFSGYSRFSVDSAGRFFIHP